MIFSIISFLLISLTFYNGYKFFKLEPELIKEIYFRRAKDYLWAFLLVVFVFTTLIILSNIQLPNFLTFSWLKLLGAKSGTNLITNPGISGSTNQTLQFFGSLIFYSALIFFLPYLAKIEEVQFRSYKISIKDRIISSIKFGFIHMIVGVPVFAALILCIIGYIFSMKYVKSFDRAYNKYQSTYFADEEAIYSATSLHAKFNFLIISLVLISIIISYFGN
jgi:hypothetical protein